MMKITKYNPRYAETGLPVRQLDFHDAERSDGMESQPHL